LTDPFSIPFLWLVTASPPYPTAIYLGTTDGLGIEPTSHLLPLWRK